MNIFERILNREEFKERPPVLFDIGAAGEINKKWKEIARYSICIAFDADEREMGYTKKESSGYRQLFIYHCIATDEKSGQETFFLTKSPQCSSRLLPMQKSLDNWSFAELFHVEKKVMLKTVDLATVLKELNIKKVDWFKTDSQGTDLRLFKSLGDEIVKKTLVAEFEPGIIDAYQGEDKLWSLMAYMDKMPFWMNAIDIKGSQRVSIEIARNKLTKFDRSLARFILTTSPGWGEVSYLHMFPQDVSYLDKRDYLLGWVFTMIEHQHGFALEIAEKGYHLFQDVIFHELELETLKQIKRRYFKLPFVFFHRLNNLISKQF
jgi:Methyltransferase FkbM domain